jgi:hypothetical protein
MRTETGTFELCDNDMMIRELTSAKTNEVVGGVGTATVSSLARSGAGSTLSVSGTFTLATTNTSAFAAISETVSATGPNNRLSIAASASVV